jgi:hyperosmotically inducible periplasmic protein
MKRFLQILVMAVCLCSVAFADKNPPTDDRIQDEVRMKLAVDADVKGGDLDVVVKDGAVVLKGKVDTDRAKHRAETLAKHVKGVKSVDNEITVGPKY